MTTTPVQGKLNQIRLNKLIKHLSNKNLIKTG